MGIKPIFSHSHCKYAHLLLVLRMAKVVQVVPIAERFQHAIGFTWNFVPGIICIVCPYQTIRGTKSHPLEKARCSFRS